MIRHLVMRLMESINLCIVKSQTLFCIFFKEFCMFLQLFVWPICKWVSDVLKIIL